MAESIAFLEWMRDGHFTFLGCREYGYAFKKGSEAFKATGKMGLGVLRDPGVHVLAGATGLAAVSEEVRDFLTRPELLIVTKTKARSRAHRIVPMVYVGVKRYGKNGQVIGEMRFVGLFTATILGLMKAQMVKSAVIVPVGAKGGFVVKRPPTTGGREAFLAEGIACYQLLMRGLLDLTDNQGTKTAKPPADVIRHEGDDTYLVVAADKGTATFSDIANGMSRDYGFWLDDAFASGGSVGYDHKKMGITAKGAWESVKRHFREIGLDTQRQDFTVVGIGDMAGDVFGNGMMLSKHIKLLAAFNHIHIFCRSQSGRSGQILDRTQAAVQKAPVSLDRLRR